MFILLLLSPGMLSAEEWTARVVNVHDADTVVVLHNGKAETIRLNSINCPEAGEPGAERARKYVSEAIAGKNVKLKTYGKDRYGRTIADIILDKDRLLNQELVRSGNCRWGRSRAMLP